MNSNADALIRFERTLGRLLVAGVTLSAFALGAGLVLFLTRPSASAGPVLLTGGLLILMATPMLRVIVSIVEYVRMRDWLFVLTTSAVLVELAITVIYSLHRQ